MLVLICVLIFNTNPAVSQFPSHLDFEKAGEITFNKVKYNVLRPTVHMVRDHFQDFMLKKESTGFPTKRVFMDDSGLRHYWSGFEEHSEILRKANALETEILNEKIESQDHKLNIESTTTGTETIPVLTTDLGTKTETKNSDSEVVENQENKSKENGEELKENKGEGANQSVENQSDEKVETTTRRHLKRRKKQRLLPPPSAFNPNLLRQDTKERTIVKTTFFCPFFGVMTMQSYFDTDEKK